MKKKEAQSFIQLIMAGTVNPERDAQTEELFLSLSSRDVNDIARGLPASLAAEVAAANKGARVRTLSDSDVARFAVLWRRAAKLAHKHKLGLASIKIEVNAGCVANAYRGAAMSSTIFASGVLVGAHRCRARTTRYGVGVEICRVRLPASHPSKAELAKKYRYHGGYLLLGV